MPERPALSKGEMEVARILWELKKATVREVHEALPAQRQMDFATVQTYLRRLDAKGLREGGPGWSHSCVLGSCSTGDGHSRNSRRPG